MTHTCVPSEPIPLGSLNAYLDSEITLRRPPLWALSSVTEFPLPLTIQTCSPSEAIDMGIVDIEARIRDVPDERAGGDRELGDRISKTADAVAVVAAIRHPDMRAVHCRWQLD